MVCLRIINHFPLPYAALAVSMPPSSTRHPPGTCSKKNIPWRIEGERGHYMKQNEKHTNRRCCCTKGTKTVEREKPGSKQGKENPPRLPFVDGGGSIAVALLRGRVGQTSKHESKTKLRKQQARATNAKTRTSNSKQPQQFAVRSIDRFYLLVDSEPCHPICRLLPTFF